MVKEKFWQGRLEDKPFAFAKLCCIDFHEHLKQKRRGCFSPNTFLKYCTLKIVINALLLNL